ncbi:MAG: arsenite methyltransferase [Nitriliruptoraceae bacterium]
MSDVTREDVRARYAAAARSLGEADGRCCDPARGCGSVEADSVVFGGVLYDGTGLDGLPESLVQGSLGCGVPTEVADLRSGEIVLDLGSGAGLDVLLSARRVGPSGHVYGLDMTEEMVVLARRHAAEVGIDNVTFIRGEMEDIPLPDRSVDVVLSNCVVNLSTDKPAVVTELARIVRPGGRLAISDVVAEDHLSAADRAERGSLVGCIAGAWSFAAYVSALTTAGFVDVAVMPSHEVADGMHAATIHGRRAA